MIFIANVLVMNGGTTFILRLTRELHRRGRRSAILLLSDLTDPVLAAEISRYADIIPLRRYLRYGGVESKSLSQGLLRTFTPLSFRRLKAALAPYGEHVHVMGVFGFILALRLLGVEPRLRVTVGIYHQNEFLYRSPPFFFPRRVQDLFAAVPSENVVFFNEWSRANYAARFGNNDYIAATLVPVGIEIDLQLAPPPATIGSRIISVGNLESFKTYNRHMIDVVAALKENYPEIQYDIYGTGPMKETLKTQARNLGVSDRVTLHGKLDYSKMREVVAGCDLFVGSGTALVEAAAAGRPALIGIESIETAETYGYLSEGQGYSYHENTPQLPKQPIVQLVTRLFSDRDHWMEVASACAEKAKSFSVEATADGFEAAGSKAHPINLRLSPRELWQMAVSVIAMAISERLGWSEPFSHRRNQSYRAEG